MVIKNRKHQRIYNKTKKYLKKTENLEIDSKQEIIFELLKIKEKRKQYSYLYDLVCEYLDQEFATHNYCSFINNICARRRCVLEKKNKKIAYPNGCCYSIRHGKICKYWKASGCSIKNIACKLFTCSYLRKHNIRFSLDKIYLTKYTLNRKQKIYLSTTFFKEKEEIVDGLLKRRGFYGM